jgi:hypothetical protein
MKVLKVMNVLLVRDFMETKCFEESIIRTSLLKMTQIGTRCSVTYLRLQKECSSEFLSKFGSVVKQ